MRRVTLRSVWEHKRRLVSTLLAVALGVGFMSGTGVFGQTLNSVFDDLFATISENVDARVQGVLETELYAAMTRFSAIGAAGIVLDVKTGEVIAMTSLPQLNPNKPGRNAEAAGFNRATMGVYELGSTFKPFTVAMAMDSGVVKSFGQMYNCPSGLPAGGFTITDTHPFNRACSVAEIEIGCDR